MKPIKLILVFLILCFSVAAQNQGNDAASIRAQMAAIRKSTNWNDPAAAKAANTKIQELAAKLTQALRQSNPNATQMNGMTQKEAAELQKETDDFNNELWNQMMKIVREGGKWDMAEPLREEIVQEYKDDEDPTIKNPEWLQSMTYLLVNLSLPQVQVIIDQMPMYKGIKTLIITTEKPVANVNLSKILKNAQGYPLEELYIINLGTMVSNLPPEAGSFANLQKLGIYNNGFKTLPPMVSGLSNLTSLQIQNNPIGTILPVINNLKKLQELGVAMTSVSAAELGQIQKNLPNCKITTE
ncbi:MAG: hypothetical protein JNK09_03880 [Prolixibacteraceae bacterium]|nr:hypothetical protein [Prolixibacteraceae bacterium]